MKAIQRRSQRDRQVKRRLFKLRRDAGDVLVASYSEVQWECHSRVQDQLQQRPASGIEKYGTKVHVQEDHSDEHGIWLVRSVYACLGRC